MEYHIPRSTTAVQGIPIGRLANLESRVSILETTGAGLRLETPSGTVNGINRTFTVLNAPRMVVIDGNIKVSGSGYTYAAGTITVDQDNPPVQFIRSIY